MIDEKNASILVIEDNDASAGTYVRLLEEEKYLVQRAAAMNEGIQKADAFRPDVILLDLQIPSEPGLADEDVAHGLSTLDALLKAAPFRPVVIVTAHSRDRELMRSVLQRNRGGAFVFKDEDDLELAMKKAVAVALASPAYRMSKTVEAFRALVDRNEEEETYRKFIRSEEHTSELQSR